MIERLCHILSHLPFEWADYAFMRYALLGVLLISPMFALLGCTVVQNRMAFFSDAIGHAALTGLAIGFLAGLADPMPAMLGFAVCLAVIVTTLRRWSRNSTDTLIGLVMAFAVALGVMILSRGGHFSKYTGFLIGDVLTIGPDDVRAAMILWVVMLLVWGSLYNRFFLVSINPAFARSRGFSPWWVESVFATLVALTVTLSVPWMGLLVVNSLLIAPAAAARNLARNTRQYHAWAVALALLSGAAGLITAYYLNAAAGATIALYALGCYALSLLFRAD